MQADKPSQTALRVAISRAAHQLLDAPTVFDDPLAIQVVGPAGAAAIRAGGRSFTSEFSQRLRAFFAARSRLAEEELALAVQRGVRQYVVLGAGLDTFAYRNPHAAVALRVFEVDHPATQAWKRHMLDAANISIPHGLTCVPVDFETQSLAQCLQLNGLRSTEPTFFSWLGVSMYLRPQVVLANLRYMADAAGTGGGVVFDYLTPIAQLGFAARLRMHVLTRRLKAMGEPWQGYFDSEAMALALSNMGFLQVQDMGSDAINQRYFAQRADGLCVGGSGHLVSART